MSSDNAEFVLETFHRFSADDLTRWGERWHEDARSTPADGWPEPGPFVGRDAIVAQFENLFADWSEYEITDVQLVADADPWVVVTWRMNTRGAASGLEATLEMGTAFLIDGGRIREGH